MHHILELRGLFVTSVYLLLSDLLPAFEIYMRAAILRTVVFYDMVTLNLLPKIWAVLEATFNSIDVAEHTLRLSYQGSAKILLMSRDIRT